MKPYGLMADLHLHNWSAFSSSDEKGRNVRLVGLLNEVTRCAAEVQKAGGNTMYIAGDVFHVRGSVAPSVLNLTLDTFLAITASGIRVVILPGNHDLEGKHTTRLGSAVTALESVGVEVIHHTTHLEKEGVAVIPWFDKVDQLEEELLSLSPEVRSTIDVLIHAPIDGVISGLPDHGLSAEKLHKMGFKRVFGGHYHNHKDFGNGVYSIGALAHHSWSDVGSKAGFLIVSEDDVRWMKSHLPEFIDINEKIKPDDLPLIVEGNFCRAKIESSSMADVESLRLELMGMGAKGVVIQSIKKPTVERDGVIAATVSAGASIETSVAEYLKSKSFAHEERVALECMNVLSEAGC